MYPEPPATNTVPLVNSVAVLKVRANERDPAFIQVLVDGSYNSVLTSVPNELEVPPATSTFPVARSVAVGE
jgi:hypothetical protein